MKKRLGIVVLLALGGATLWWFIRPVPNAPLSAKVAEAPAALKSLALAPTPKPIQVEAPKVAPVLASDLGQGAEPVSTANPDLTNDFGMIEVTAGQPMRLPLKSGKVIDFTPKLLPGGNMEFLLNVKMEVQMSDGIYSVGQGYRFILAHGESINFPQSGNYDGFSLTPVWKSN